MKTILDFLIENKRHPHISFHVPGHKSRTEIFRKAGYGEFFDGILEGDISEIPGADSYLYPEGLIRSTMEYYADLYGAQHAELLVNGTGSGVLAAILACVPRGGKLILGRNSQHGAFSALRLGGIRPVYMRPEFNPENGLQEGVLPSEVRMACEDNPDASAVLITSPNYFGMLSDIGRIAEIAHHYGMTLIVDQSHGAHLRFFDVINETETAAEGLGADIVINGIDETLLGANGSGVLLVCSDRVNINELQDSLRMFRSTNASYLALGILDINEKILRRYGGDMVRSWVEDLRYAYSRLEVVRGVELVRSDRLDPTKINISLAEIGVSGEQLARELRYKGIIPEIVHGEYVVLATGAGNRRDDYIALVNVVREVTNGNVMGAYETSPVTAPDFVLGCTTVPVRKCEIPLYQADGRVLYDPIITYPPGSPIACPGEIMNLEVISYVAHAVERGERVVGVDEEGRIVVGEINMTF